MNKNTTMATSVTKKKSYNPNSAESVANFWEGAKIEHKGKIIGTAHRPEKYKLQKNHLKIQVTLKLSLEVLEFFKNTGKNWQKEMNKALLKHVHTRH